MSWNLNLVCDIQPIQLGVLPIKMSSIKPLDIKNKFSIIHRDSDGKEVKFTTTIDNKRVSTNKSWINEDGKLIDKSEVRHFIQKEDGTESEIAEFTMTKNLEIMKFIPKIHKEQFLLEKKAELFVKMPKKKSEQAIAINSKKGLLKLANWLKENKKLGVAKFSFGRGFKIYIGLIDAVMTDDAFVLTMDLTQKKLEYENLMSKTITAISEEQPRNLPTLPIELNI